ncbi:MAG: hypothetical protein J6036_00195 [Clostridia bacterium]|nr:hypothetical protein [Clostridia bacterium]
MPHKEIKIAKNVTKLLGICWDRNMSEEQIHILTKPIREAGSAREREAIASKIIEELQKTSLED